jgi:DNA (cytosine-5)-methyltransferase 1
VTASAPLPPGEPLNPSWKIAALVPHIRPGENGARALLAAGRKGNNFNVIRLAWGMPAPTIVKFSGGWRTALIHPAKDEQPTGRELCRLQSFPDQFRWGDSTYAQIHDRLGNSVPPLLMRAVAATVRDALDGKRSHDAIRPALVTGYGAELSAAWADHLAPRKPDAPTVVSLFAGCGGSSLGYSMAGFRELLAVEWDDHAAAMFALNFPDVPLHHGDVAALDPAVLDLASGELDVLDGSPPCQGFSTSGRRRADDPRSELFREYVRLLDTWRPRMFVMENVSGLVKGKMRLKFAEMLAALKAAGPGYRVVVRLLDASRFGVPQQRQRLIFLGTRSDLPADLTHPRPTSARRTVRDAWADLAQPGEYGALGAQLTQLIPHIAPGKSGKETLIEHGRAIGFWDWQRLRWDRPSKTIARTPCLLHPDEDRKLGTREAARLQSFPDEYEWRGSSCAQILARLGNSVPPLLMRATAEAARNALDGIGRRVVQS